MVPALMLLRGGGGGCYVHRCGVSSVDSTECLTSYLPTLPKGLFPRLCAFRPMPLWNIVILCRVLAKRDPRKNEPRKYVTRVICIEHKALVDQSANIWLFALLSACLSVCGEV